MIWIDFIFFKEWFWSDHVTPAENFLSLPIVGEEVQAAMQTPQARRGHSQSSPRERWLWRDERQKCFGVSHLIGDDREKSIAGVRRNSDSRRFVLFI